MFAINYEGLKKRETYDEIVDYLENKQDKIKYPDRTAKQLRNSPQLSNLLDGNNEGYEEMEEQQKRHTKEITKETIIREVAGQNNETAQVLRAVDRISGIADNLEGRSTEALTRTNEALGRTTDTLKRILKSQVKPKTSERETQTKNPVMKNQESQAWKPNVSSSGTQSNIPTASIETQSNIPVSSSSTQSNIPSGSMGTQTGPQIFDMTLDDNKDDHAMQIDLAIEDQQRDNTQQIQNIVQTHLGTTIEHAIPYLQSMETNTQQKRQITPSDEKPKAKSKTTKGDELVIAETSLVEAKAKPKAKAKARSSSRKGTRQETDNPEGPARRPRSRPPARSQPASSSTDNPPPSENLPGENQPEETTRPKPKAKAKSGVKKTIEKDKPETPRPTHNIAKDTNTDPQYWSKKSTTKAYIKNQLEQHHGSRFTKTQIKGFTKDDYVKMIKEKLGI